MSVEATSPSYNLVSSSSPSPAATRRRIVKRAGFTRQRRGCLTCRQRKKKCDQSLPICGHCSRLNLVCKQEEPRQLPQRASASSSTVAWGVDTTKALPTSSHSGRDIARLLQDQQPVSEVLRLAKIHEPLDLMPASPSVGNSLVASRRTMMRYYTTTLAIMLSATAENNCFLSVLLPMAFDCPTLLDAMAAWSSAHLALQYPYLENTALQYRGRALSNLTSSLKRGDLTSEMCLAVTMAMCSMDTISIGTSNSWSHHLAGATAILQSKCHNVQSSLGHKWLQSFEAKWLLRNFAYHDILMSVSLDRRPFISGDYWMSADDETADPYFAFASRIMLSTSEISVLNADYAEQPSDDGAKFEEFLRRAHRIATELRKWRLPTSVSADAPLALLSETYRSAALIYLDRVARKHLPHSHADVVSESVQVYVASICNLVQKIPEGSLSECSLLFPIFIAGGAADNLEHIQCLRDRLYTMNKWRRFRNVDACREVLEQVWLEGDRYNHGLRPNRVDWRDILEQKGWQLALS